MATALGSPENAGRVHILSCHFLFSSCVSSARATDNAVVMCCRLFILISSAFCREARNFYAFCREARNFYAFFREARNFYAPFVVVIVTFLYCLDCDTQI